MYDKKATQKLLNDYNAKKGVARVNKSILEGCEKLRAISNHAAKSYNTHSDMTQPFNDSGMRILAAPMFPKYNQTMTAIISEHEALVTDFLSDYQWEIDSAKVAQGDLYNPAEYPNVDQVASKFGMWVNYYPMPSAGHWAIDMAQEQRDELVSGFTNTMTKVTERALNDIWSKAHKYVSNLSAQLGRYDTMSRPKLFDSLLDHVFDITEIMQLCNPTKDMHMEAVRQKLESALEGVTIEQLKDNKHLRDMTKKKVDDIIKELPSLDI
jgi:hypothetical protein